MRTTNTQLQETKSEELPVNLDDKVALLTGAKDAIPPLFKESTTYMVDMLALIDIQRELLEELEQQALYNEQTKERLARGAARGIDVEVASGTEKMVQRRIDPQAIAGWSRRMNETLDVIVAQNRSNDPIGLTIARYAAKNLPLALKLSSLMTGTVLGAKNLSKDQRNELLKLSPQEKAKRFSSEGRAWDISGFDLKRFPNVRNLEDLPEVVRSSNLAYEQSILAMQIHVLLQNDQGVIDERMDTLKARLNAVSEGDLDLFVDKAAFEERFQRLIKSVTLQNASDAQKLISQSVREVSQTTITEQVKVEGVRLEEAAHWLGMLRGMGSGDCSTDRSAGFSALPTEYVFLVYDTKGRILGYAASTIVRDKATKLLKLYVHTIAGKRMQASHALGVFEGLRSIIANLGLTGMALPPSSKVNSLNNFAAPRGVFLDILNTRAKGSKEIEYSDAPLRDIVAKTNEGEYDLPASNANATEIDLSQSFFGAVQSEVKIRDSALLNAKPRPPTPEEKRFLVLDLIVIGASKEAAVIAKQTGKDIEAFKALDQVFRNESGLPLAQYQRSVIDGFVTVGVANADAAVFKNFPYYFALGMLRAEDAFSPDNFNATMDIFVEELRLSGVPELSDAVYEEHRLKIAASAKLATYIRGLDVIDGGEDRALVQTLLEKLGGGAWSAEWELLNAKKLAAGGLDAGTALGIALFLRETKSESKEVQEIMRRLLLSTATASAVRRELLEVVAVSKVDVPGRNQTLLEVFTNIADNRIDAARAIVKTGMYQEPTYRAQIDVVLDAQNDPLTAALIRRQDHQLGGSGGPCDLVMKNSIK